MADEKGWVPASKAAAAEGSATGDDAFDKLFGQLASNATDRGQDGGASQVFSQAHNSDVRAGVFASEETPPVAIPRETPRLTTVPMAPVVGGFVGPSTDNPDRERGPFSQEPAAALQAQAGANAPGDFTRIFTQLPTPSSPPPAVLAEVSQTKVATPEVPRGAPAEASLPAVLQGPAPQLTKPPAAPPGEFTQFFQALNPAAEPGQAASTDRLESSAAAAREHQAVPPASQAFAPSPPTAPGSAAPASQGSASASPGGFTAFFQAARPDSQPAPSSPQEFAPVSQPAPDTWPLHPPASQPAGGRSPAPFEALAPPPAQAGGNQSASGGFTELLRSLASAPAPGQPASASGFAPAAAQADPQPVREAFRPTPAPPAPAYAAPQAAPTGGPGEFTQLLASLKAPAAEAPGTPTPAAPSPFFAAGSAPLSQQGASEFTRIMQGSAARSAEAPVPAFAPAPQSSGAAVGLPIAAPAALPKFAAPPVPAPAAAAKTTLQKLMPWLLGANAVLLLAIVALVLLYLRHKH